MRRLNVTQALGEERIKVEAYAAWLPADPDDFTEDEFKSALRKTSRRLPSQPDEASSGT